MCLDPEGSHVMNVRNADERPSSRGRPAFRRRFWLMGHLQWRPFGEYNANCETTRRSIAHSTSLYAGVTQETDIGWQ
jgi:hypothetical protein